MQAPPPPPPPPIVDCAVILSGQKLICHKPCSSIKMRSRHHHFPRVYCPSITRDLKPLDVLRDTQSSVKSHLSWLHWTHLLFHTVLKHPIKRPVKKNNTVRDMNPFMAQGWLEHTSTTALSKAGAPPSEECPSEFKRSHHDAGRA